MSHIMQSLHDSNRAPSGGRSVYLPEQVRIHLDRALEAIGMGILNRAEESLKRAQDALTRQEETLKPGEEMSPLGSLRALTVNGLLNAAHQRFDAALKAHETVAEMICTFAGSLDVDDVEVERFLELHGQSLEDMRAYKRYNSDDDYALSGALKIAS